MASEPDNWQDDSIDLLANVGNWCGYVDALRKRDSYWRSQSAENISVLGEEWSWIDTIAHGHTIAQRSDWVDLSREEKKILLGLDTNDAAGAWGLLGNIHAAAEACSLFQTDAAIRGRIRKTLQPVIDANDQNQFILAAAQAIRLITQLHGFGPAIATRLITLARPDMGISVNGGSAPKLSQLTGLSKAAGTLGKANNYPKLLQWVYAQPWYNTSEPEGSLEQTIWSMRAALIDGFVYQPV
jgi:hypothetical protein